jgi:hypothetical protein
LIALIVKRFLNDCYHEKRKLGEVPVADGSTVIDIKQMPSDFYKTIIEAPYNFLNRWVIVNKGQVLNNESK